VRARARHCISPLWTLIPDHLSEICEVPASSQSTPLWLVRSLLPGISAAAFLPPMEVISSSPDEAVVLGPSFYIWASRVRSVFLRPPSFDLLRPVWDFSSSSPFEALSVISIVSESYTKDALPFQKPLAPTPNTLAAFHKGPLFRLVPFSFARGCVTLEPNIPKS